MIQEPLDFKRALQLVRRHKIIVIAAAVVGLVAGAALAVVFVSVFAGASAGCCALRLAAPTARVATRSNLWVVFIFMDYFRVPVVL